MPQEHVKNTIFIGVDDANSGALLHWCVGLAFFCKTTCICQNHRRFGIKSAKKKWIGKQWSLIWKFFPAHHNTPKKKKTKARKVHVPPCLSFGDGWTNKTDSHVLSALSQYFQPLSFQDGSLPAVPWKEGVVFVRKLPPLLTIYVLLTSHCSFSPP